jgi:iron complex outermembrane recepter protein
MSLFYRLRPRMVDLLVAAAVAMLGALPAFATEIHRFDIPAQDAPAAIRDFGSQAHVQILVAGEHVKNKQLHAVSGDLSTDEGLQLLLAGSGLIPQYVGERSIALLPADQARAAANSTSTDPAQRSSGEAGPKPESSSRFRVARADQAGAANSSSVDDGQLADGRAVLQEIVVTASKREETLSSAAMAISVVSQKDLDQSGVHDAGSLVGQVPGLQFSQNGFSIRGVGSSNLSDQSFSTVATQIDGIYEQRPEVLEQGLYDVNRIEVLRGPQGTLYGRNATAGVVNIITNDPQHTLAGGGDLSYGNFNEFIARGFLNIPVTDSWALRGSFIRKQNRGYVDTTVPNGDRFDKADTWSGRLTSLWTPNEHISWRLAVSYASDTGTINDQKPIYYATFPAADFAAGTMGAPSAGIAFGSQTFPPATGSKNDADNQETAVRSNLTWHVNDALSLTYLFGYSHFDNSGMLLLTPSGSFEQDNHVNARSHELDVNFEMGRFSGLGGLYYYREDQNNAALLHEYGVLPSPYDALIGVPSPVPVALPLVDVLSHSPDRYSVGKAAFTQESYNITDSLKLTAGLRYSQDRLGNPHQNLVVCQAGTATAITPEQTCGVPFLAEDIGQLSTRSNNVSWKGTAEYNVTDAAMVYATVSTGYRSGGVADRSAPVLAQTFRPETVTNYELGTRTLWLDRSLSLNVTGFDMNYKNLQVTSFLQQPGSVPTPVTLNAAAATIRGVEIETAWRLTTSDTLHAFATYLDAKFDSFNDAYDNYGSTNGAINTVLGIFGFPGVETTPVNYSGNSLPYAPKVSFRFGYSHDFNLGSAGHLVPAINTYYQGRSSTDGSSRSVTGQGAFTKTDLTLDYQLPGEGLNFEAFVYNIENSSIIQSTTATTGLVTAAYQPPRLFGVRVGYKF